MSRMCRSRSNRAGSNTSAQVGPFAQPAESGGVNVGARSTEEGSQLAPAPAAVPCPVHQHEGSQFLFPLVLRVAPSPFPSLRSPGAGLAKLGNLSKAPWALRGPDIGPATTGRCQCGGAARRSGFPFTYSRKRRKAAARAGFPMMRQWRPTDIILGWVEPSR